MTEQGESRITEFLNCCYKVHGAATKARDFLNAFWLWLPPHERGQWSRHRVREALPDEHAAGYYADHYECIANLSLTSVPAENFKLLKVGNRLKKVPG